MSEWKEDNLGSVLEVKYGKDHKKLQNGSIPCYGSGGLMRYVDRPLYDKVSILIPRKGSLNNIMFQDRPFWTVDTMFWSKIDEEKVFPKFLFYQLTLIDYTNLNVGSAVPSLTVPVINEIEIKLPPLPEQKAIAEVLSSLDDKIDLLHRQNKTLEQMAETLFRQWFVEEAKEDWETGNILNYAVHSKDSVHPKKSPQIEFYHYSIPSFDKGKSPIKELGGDIQSNKYKVPINCVLFAKLNPHKDKRVWLLQKEVNENSICSTEFQIVKPNKGIFLYFIYGWLSNYQNFKEIASGVGGTSGSHQRIAPNIIFEFQCPIIDEDYIEEYTNQVEPIFEKQVNNQNQIRTLEKMRDTLLPKLMNDEVNINNNIFTKI